MRFRTPLPIAFRVPVLAASLLVAVLLAGCGGEPAVRLSDYARHQRDQVTTRWLPADSALAARLATDGWRLEGDEDDGAETLRMTHDRARLWFYSADGATIGAELHGAALGDEESVTRSISYRVNDVPQATLPWPAGLDTLDIPFNAGAARPGWNALELFVRREGPETERGALELRGVRFRDRPEGRVGDEGPQELRVADGELEIPAEGVLGVAFEVPHKARLRTTATSDDDSRSLTVRFALMDETGANHELDGFRLDAGDSDKHEVDLAPWSGQTVELAIRVDGPRGSHARFSRAEITAGDPQPAPSPIRPQAVEASGRLGRPDVILIVLDAARADAFGAYGSEYSTPAVDALAKVGTTFMRAQSPSSWTGQAIPALISGFHPDTLGIERWGDALPDEIPSLAEMMSAAGYRTVLWSQHPIYARTPSLVRGFEHVRYSGRGRRHKRPHRNLLFERERPTFALIHLLPPHSPYSPPAPFEGRYTSEYEGKLPPKLGALGRVGKKRMLDLSTGDLAYVRARYQENVAFADWLVSEVLGELTDAKRFAKSLVVVTSDHGEAFFEHGRFMHSRELYQEFVRIPMIVKWPERVRGFPAKVAEPMTLVDLVPTLVDGLSLENSRGFQGDSLLPALLDGAPLERSIYGTTRGLGDIDKVAKPRWMLEHGAWRVIHDPVAGRTELYSIEDTGDANDLAAEHPAEAARMLQRLMIQRSFNTSLLQLRPRTEVELDPEMVKELKALGYL